MLGDLLRSYNSMISFILGISFHGFTGNRIVDRDNGNLVN